ncbi:hypothetical protein LCGC14_2910990, partial [marine sediment metagenome]
RKKPCKNQCEGYPGPWDRSECPIHSTTWNILVVDECHKIKNKRTQRAKAVNAIKARQRLYLTGTPIVNRPVELWPIISMLDPATFSDFFKFAKRYCNPPDAPVWMGDFTFKPLGLVKVGDEVIGWELAAPGRRSVKGIRRQVLTKTRVTHILRRRAPIVRVTLASGSVIRCTADHRWLSGRSNNSQYVFVTAKPKRKLVKVIDMPAGLQAKDVMDAGYLGGIYDGEGTWPRISQYCSQNPDVCLRVERALSRLRLPYSKGEEGFSVLGGRQSAVNFANWCRPAKRKWLESRILTGRFREPDEVVSIEPDGEGEVLALTTETGNYVVWGYASKNCNARQRAFGWDFTGSSHLDELQDKLRGSIMVRRLKKDVLSELPPKIRQVI